MSMPLARRDYPRLPVTVALTVVLNSLIALSLWLLVPAMGNLGTTFVYSQCVGLAILATSVAIGRLGPRLGLARIAHLPAPAHIAVMLVPAAPIGYIVGHLVARLLLGHPLGEIGQAPVLSAALVVTVLATAFAGATLWMRGRLVEEAQSREAAQRHAAEAELRLLRAQLEPHMLFNTLANLRELTATDAAAAQQMLDDLIVYLRAALAATRSERTTLEQEFAQQAAYLKLMARRMGPRLQWQTSLPADLRGAPVPPMLLQPLVENAIRHGLEPQVGAGSITLSAERENDDLRLTVADTGRGLRAADAIAPPLAGRGGNGSEGGEGGDGSGYGLTHVRERLRSLYGGAAALTLEPVLPHGVRAVVRLPVAGNAHGAG